MRQIETDLWETTEYRVAGGPTTHAYLWTAPGGNVLFYNLGDALDVERIGRLGGVVHQYLSHLDEISPMLAQLAGRFGSTLHSSVLEADTVRRVHQPAVLVERRHVDGHGVEVIPTPGHTPGSVCFLVDGAAGRYLFTGDTLIRGADGRWFAGYIPGYSDIDDLMATLDVLAELRPDLVASSAFTGSAGAHRLDQPWADCVAEARDQLIERHGGELSAKMEA